MIIRHLAILLSLSLPCTAADWPWWRGEHRTGIADPDQKPPVEFSPTSSNVQWVAPIPGRGHGSPMVFKDRVYLATAENSPQRQSLLCLDRKTGKPVWTTVVHEGGFPPKTNKKASHASSTPACDGERIYINFVNSGGAHLTALNLDGEKLWTKRLCDYIVHQGYGSSPAIYKSLIIASADNKAGGAICAFDRVSGEQVWKVDRAKKPNYASPMIFEIGGRDQLIFQGTDLVTSLDPRTGEKIWETKGSTTECVSSIASDGKRVFTSGGYPKNHVAAMTADGSGDIEWENTSRVYVPSMLVKDGHIFAVMDAGIAACWDCETGDERWKERLGRPVSGSPVLVGDHIYCGDEAGQFFVFNADPDEFKIVARNKLGDQTLSTPAICGGQIFARVADQDGDTRQEKLYCIGERTN